MAAKYGHVGGKGHFTSKALVLQNSARAHVASSDLAGSPCSASSDL